MDKIVTKMRIYNHLTQKGFTPKTIRENLKDKSRLVWIYDETEELNKAIEEFYNQEQDTRNEDEGRDMFVVTFPMEKAFFSKWGISPDLTRTDMNNPNKKVWLYKQTPAFKLILEHYNKLTLLPDGNRRTYWCVKRSRMKDYMDKRNLEPALSTYDANGYHIWWYEVTDEFQDAKEEYFANINRGGAKHGE